MAPPHTSTPPSVLKPWQRRLLAVCLGLGLFMAANTVYLLLNRLADGVAAAGPDGSPLHLPRVLQVMVLSHTGVGILLMSLVTAFVAVHLPRVWRLRTGRSVGSGVAALAAGVVLLVTGLFILTAAASEANRWAWWLHVAAAAVLPAAYVVHRSVGATRLSRPGARRFALVAAAAVAVLAVVHLVESRQAGAGRTAGAGDGVPAVPDSDFEPAALPPAGSPFFPSSVTTTSGGAVAVEALIPGGTRHAADPVTAEVNRRGFNATVAIGAEQCARCHADIVAQWSTSAHRFSSFNNPFYEASFRELRETAGGSNAWIDRHAAAYGGQGPGGVGTPSPAAVKSRFCGGCHDPAVMLTGAMDGPVRRETVAAQAGLTCMACHAVDRIHGVTGNGNYNLNGGAGDPYLFADAPAGTLRAFLHDAAVRARPATHKALLARPVFSTSEYCATCHKVSLPEAVNGYRWLRGQNVYDPWHDSGVSRNAARTFYLPEFSRECQDCHMPPEPATLGDLAARDGTVRSHRFLAANTALPHLRGDTATVRRIEDYLGDGKLRVDVFGLRGAGVSGGERGASRGGAGEEETLVMAVDEANPTVRPGGTVTVDVVVRNVGVGHTFPGGTNDSNQGWLEFTVLDGQGSVIWRSGALDGDGRLDPLAHRYGAVLLDGEGRPIQRRNGQDIHVPAAVQVIGPGTADVGHYQFSVPAAPAGGVLTLRARLLWRKFDGAFSRFAWETNREGFASFSQVPVLPVTEIARDQVVVRVAGAGGAAAGQRQAAGAAASSSAPGDAGTAGRPGTAPWVRFNDYGIALLLEGNTRLARRAFRRVAELAPDRIDGALNLARTSLAAGDIEAAYRHLETVEEMEPGNGRAAWVWGRVLQEDGRYDEAEMAYRRVLQEFPEDRGAWRNLGQVLYLNGRPGEAVEALDAVLALDPEDRVAHYFRMLALRVAGRDREAAVAEAAFEYYRIDESAQILTRRYRSENPGVNLMAQPIHTHEPAGGRR